MSRKLVLSLLLLMTAIACLGLGATLLVRSFTEPSSLFMTAAESVRSSDDFSQYLSMVFAGTGIAILFFLTKYWK